MKPTDDRKKKKESEKAEDSKPSKKLSEEELDQVAGGSIFMRSMTEYELRK